MVKELKKENKKLYLCEECNMYYSDKSWAEKCETWCKKYKSCNIDIIKKSV